jgi:type II secretory pathway pseudopilin PulG
MGNPSSMTISSSRPAVSRSGAFTLVELVVVIGIVGLVLAAVLLLFEASSRSARKVMERETAESDAERAAAEMETLISSAGLTTVAVYGEWHPILLALPDHLSFVSNAEHPDILGSEDTITIECTEEGISARDGSGEVIFQSSPSVGTSFAYIDGSGCAIDPVDLDSPSGRDRIRRIEWTVDAAYRDGTVRLSRSCSPPNLMLR